MHIQHHSQVDVATRDQRRVAYFISKTVTDIFGKELGIAGLPKVAAMVNNKPWVRNAQAASTGKGDFQMVFCQLDEHKVLVAEVS